MENKLIPEEAERQCPVCETPLKYIKGISKKNGKAYAGWICPNGKECGFTGEWQRVYQGETDVASYKNGKPANYNAMIMTELEGITKMIGTIDARITAMAEYLKSKGEK